MENNEGVFQVVVPNDKYFPKPILDGPITLPLMNGSLEDFYVEKIIYNQSIGWKERIEYDGSTLHCGSYSHNRVTPIEAVLKAGAVMDVKLLNDWVPGKKNDSGNIIENPSSIFDFSRFRSLENFRVIACHICNDEPIKETEIIYPVRGKLAKKDIYVTTNWWESQKLALVFE